MKGRGLNSAILLTAFVLLIAGCGGDGGDGGTGTKQEAAHSSTATTNVAPGEPKASKPAAPKQPEGERAPRRQGEKRPQSAAGGSSPAQATGSGHAGSKDGAAADVGWTALVRQADAICKRANNERRKLLKAYIKKDPPGSSAAASAAYREDLILEVALPPYETEIRQLPKLAASGDDGRRIGELVAGLREAIAKSKKEPLTVLDGSGKQFDRVEARSKKLGFKVCGRA